MSLNRPIVKVSVLSEVRHIGCWPKEASTCRISHSWDRGGIRRLSE